MPKLTKRVVDQITPGSTETVHWDDELKGFRLRVWPTGRKVYIVKCRVKGRQRRVTIGTHGNSCTAESARDEAFEILSEARRGKGSAAEAKQARKAPTMKALGERFLKEHVESHCKPSTRGDYKHIVEKLINPRLGNRKVSEIARKDIADLHHALRNIPYQANRARATLSKMFNLAEIWNLRPDGSNPCRHIKKYGEKKRERMLSNEEFAALGHALNRYPGSKHVVGAIKLLMFTGARLSEVLGLQWSWVNLERGVARLPDSKTGAKTIQLPPPAVELLEKLPKIEGNPHVVVGQREGSCLVNLEKPWRYVRQIATIQLWRQSSEKKVSALVSALAKKLKREPTVAECRKAAVASKIELPTGVLDLRLHDLRHAFASIGASSGMGLPIIGKMLGHSQPSTTARYAHLAPDSVKEAAAAVAAQIARVIKVRPARVA